MTDLDLAIGPDLALDPDVLYEEVKRRAEFERDFEQPDEWDVDIADNRPVAIVAVGDLHAGHKSVDYQAVEDKLNLIARTDGAYACGLGDYYDGYLAGMGRISTGLYDAILPSPDAQEILALKLLRICAGKWIGLTRGCHLDFSLQSAGHDILARVCRDLETINMGYGGALTVTVGRQQYRIYVRHKMKGVTPKSFRSALLEFPADAWITAHYHFTELAKMPMQNPDYPETVFLRSGGWKTDDAYGKKLGVGRPVPGMPTLILFPDQRLILPFYGADLEHALEYLTFLRTRPLSP